MDLVSWGFSTVSGWAIEHLPLYSLVTFWEQIKFRKMYEANIQNHTGAYLMQAKTSSEEKQTTHKQWLPYDLDQLQDSEIQPETLRIINDLITKKMLPQAMISDLTKKGFIKGD